VLLSSIEWGRNVARGISKVGQLHLAAKISSGVQPPISSSSVAQTIINGVEQRTLIVSSTHQFFPGGNEEALT
jgi:hypothetical protein